MSFPWQDWATVTSYLRLSRGFVALALVVATTACSGAFGIDHNIVGKIIRYQVEYHSSPVGKLSNSAVSIRYSTNDGEQEQRMVTLPWTKVVGSAREGFEPTVRAQFYGFGTISCRILADGKLVMEKVSSQEPYAVAECSA